MVVAKSLSQGTGLRIISNPNLPVATLAPPRYPFLLSGLVKIFGLESTLPYRLLSFVFWLGTIAAIGLLVRQEDGPVWGFLVAFLTAINVYIMEYAKEILAEMPYTFFSIIAILLAYKYLRSSGSRQWVWLISLIFTLTLLLHLRMVAIALVAAVALFFVLRRRIYAGLIVAVLVGLFYLPWVILWKQNQNVSFVPGVWFQTNDPFNLDAEPEPFVKVATERVISNSLYYTSATRQYILGWASFSKLSGSFIYNVLGFLIIGFILIGWWIKLKFLKTALVPLYIMFYLFILLVLVQKGVERYLIPITPFLVWYFLIGVATIIGAVGTRFTNNLPRLRLLFFAFCTGLIYSILFAGLLVASIKLPMLLGTLPPEGVEVYSYLEATDWLEDNTPANEVVLARKMDAVYLRSGRQAVRYPYTTNQDVMISFLKHYNISYIILDSLGFPSREQYLLPFLNDNKEAFEEVFQSSDGLTIIYRFNPKLVSK